MNDKKICFISCVNDIKLYNECLFYINNLYIPEGYEIEVISVQDATSMAAGYNEAMNSSDAKYKIYLHQDTFIVNPNFILDILYIFENEAIGMIGVAGSKTIPVSGIWWESSKKIGQVYESSTGEMKLLSFDSFERRYEEVKAIDGLIMITQYDISWREDIFDGWHFYDVSQSIEFIKRGLKLVISQQVETWCIHDCGTLNFRNGYEEYRKVFLSEYSEDIFPLVSILIPTYNRPDYLKVALESAIGQTYKNIEIIICDDSTNSETEELIQRKYLVKYKNIKYYRNEENLGQFQNDIKLMELSNGEFINFLMDDDIFDVRKIEKMMKYFIDDIDEKISLVTSDRKIIDEYGNENGSFVDNKIFDKESIINIKGQELIKFVLVNNYNIIGEPTTVLFRKKKLKNKFGYYKERKFICNVDQAAWFNLLEEGNAIILKECLSSFRMHSEQQLASDKMLIGGAEDYTFSLVNNWNEAFKDSKDYLKALNRCKNYNIYVENKVGENEIIQDNIKALEQIIRIAKEELPLVSILIPTHNRPEYFKIALESAINQTYPNIEIIISDNSDNHKTKELIGNYLNEYSNIKYSYDSSLGPNENWERCLEQAGGEYINFLMDDDIFHHEKIEKMMNYYLNNPNVSLVTSYRKVIDENGNDMQDIGATARLFENDTTIKGKDLTKFVLTNLINVIGEPTTVLYKREYYDDLVLKLNNETIYANNDIVRSLIALQDGDCVYISEPLSNFRIHGGQAQQKLEMTIVGLIDWYNMITHFYFVNNSLEESEYTKSLIQCNKLLYNIIELVSAEKSELREKYYETLNKSIKYILNISDNKQ